MSFNIKTIGTDGTVGNHPDVTSWLNTISLVGGSASSSTIAALNNFCNSIDSAGLRNKFYRLNLFCGNNLTSCLVPLYVNVSSTTIPAFGFGYSIDQNVGFVSNDYIETGSNGGLQGDGVAKQLIVGLTPDQIGSSTGHMSAYIPTVTGTTLARIMGAGTVSPGSLYGLERQSGTSAIYGLYGDTSRQVASSTQSGHYIVTRTSPTALTMYNNGSATQTDSFSANARTSLFDIRIFVRNFSLSLQNFWPFRILSYSIGTSMNSVDALAYYNAIQAFQTALGRNV
jgi:hypothetical protein